MKAFARLINALDQTTKTSEKVAAFVTFLREAPAADQAWAVALLANRRPRRSVSTRLLRTWAAALAAIPDWLLEESYHAVGDLSETIALLLPVGEPAPDRPLHAWMQFLQDLELLPTEEKRLRIEGAWRQLDFIERFIFNKLITGAFRVGLSQQLLVKALAQHFQLAESTVAHRLMGAWSPAATNLSDLLCQAGGKDVAQPYPFYLAYPLADGVHLAELGDVSDWQVEYKWDGIRGQVIVRDRRLFVWSRGEELVTNRFPELRQLLAVVPDGTVLDGEILAWRQQPLPFQQLQLRIGRKTPSAKILAQVPVSFMAYDVLEWQGTDIREQPLVDRRCHLDVLLAAAGSALQASPVLAPACWDEVVKLRQDARAALAEGLMLKRKNSPYRTGRRTGDWWKWKLEPFTADVVLVYAMAGHGRRANLYTDYTFAAWRNGELVPVAKAYSGLTDAELSAVDRWVRQNTVERFGPVRSVRPELVFEIAFEGIQRSSRHKSGIALRFPRLLRWRTDKPAADANHLDDLMRLLP